MLEGKSKVKPKLMSKQAAKAAAEKEHAAKTKKVVKPKAAKSPKKSAPKKSDKKKASAKSQPQPGALTTLDAQQFKILQNDAAIIIPRAENRLGSLKTDIAEFEKDVQEIIDRELWKYAKTPYKSYEAWKEDARKRLGLGKTTMYNLLGTMEATPNTSPERRKAMGRRKGNIVRDVIQREKKAGREVTPEREQEIVDAAIEKPESELKQDLTDKGLKVESGKKKKNGNGPKPDPLLFNPSKSPRDESVRDSGSGYMEGATETASQYTSVVQQAIDVFLYVYEPDLKPEEALHGVCQFFIGANSTIKGLEQKTNIEAFYHLKKQDEARKASGE